MPRFTSISEDFGIHFVYAVAFFAMGGFLSVAMGTRPLTIEDQFWVNFFYGGIRIIIALICGIFVTFLIRAGVALPFLKEPGAMDGFIIAAFLSGFSAN